MASGSTGGRGGKGFDFGSDDILCSYEDYGSHKHGQDPSNGSSSHSDPSKDFHKSRISRSSGFQSASYGLSEDSISHEILVAVDRSMKNHFDNLMRFLEGVSSRLSQLELYCYNLDKSIGEMKSDLIREHGETDTKLKSLEKHMQEVHRAVQILRDKQELADTQKELAKLQLLQKESPSSTHSASSIEEKLKPSVTDATKTDQQAELPNQQLALALPHQIPPQSPAPVNPPQLQPQALPQHSYYAPPQLPAAPAPPQALPPQHPPTHYVQEMSRIPQQQYPPHQQQWQQQPQQPPQQPPQQVSSQTALPPSSKVYSTFLPPGQPPETLQNPSQITYAAVPNRSNVEVNSYGFAAARPVLPPQTSLQVKNAYVPQQGDGYASSGPHLPPRYVIYEGEGGRHHSQGVYPAGNLSSQNPQPNASGYMRNNPYSELIEKMVNMGFRGDHVVGVIQRLEESGQAVDFHAILDRLNVHSSGGSQRGWSG